jgi:ATP-dependent DNA helicase RecQ
VLKTRRLQLARDQGVPPYIIFHDNTLREMAVRRPMDEDSLRTISGVGEQKLTRFGAIFIDLIRKHASSGSAQTL